MKDLEKPKTMGNKQQKEKAISNHLSRKGIESVISGFARKFVQQSLVPMEIILICCDFYGSPIITELSLPSISLQFGNCVGHFGKIYAITVKDSMCLTASQDGKPII